MTKQTEQLLIILENERRYVAKELHDGLAQTTLQIGLQAGLCLKLLEAEKLDMLANELRQLEERSQLASTQVRDVISDMRPPKVEPEADFEEYLQFIIDTHHERGGPPITCQNEWGDDGPDLSPIQLVTLVRIIQETLLNVHKHAKAEQVQLNFQINDDSFLVSITDDGFGFDPMEVEARPADKGGAGIANLHARTEMLGGTLTINRNILGRGIKVELTLPK